MLPWLLCGILALAVAALLVKLRLLQRTMDEIVSGMDEKLSSDTNTLISIPSRDAHALRLASELNRQLRLLRDQRRRYLSGDRELKEAVSNISHDLRTPLTAVCGYLDLLEGQELSGDTARYVAAIRERAEAMKVLAEELFRYSVIVSAREPMELETLCVNSVLEESLASFYGALSGRGIVPSLDICPEKVLRPLNKTALLRIFGNILSNALKYSDGDLAVTLTPDGCAVFTNRASALSEVEVGRLFDRFFTVEAARNSTGLGLAIARTLAERMGGSVSAAYAAGTLSISLRFPGGAIAADTSGGS